MKDPRDVKDNVAYYLCLLDWGKILEPKMSRDFGTQVVPRVEKHKEGWMISEPLKCTKLNDLVKEAKMGFYHSRLIFQFCLKEAPHSINKFRDDRSRITEWVEDFLKKKVVNTMEKYIEKDRNGSAIIPNFYALMVEKHDYVYFPTLKEYPTTTLPKGLLRLVRSEDLTKTFKCGEPEIDKIPIEEYIDFLRKGYLTYVIEERDVLVAILHFYCAKEHVEVEVLAVAEGWHKRNYGAILLRFLFDWCRFSRKRYITLRASEDRERFYKKKGFERIGENGHIKMKINVY